MAAPLLIPLLPPLQFGIAHGIPHCSGGALPPGVWFLIGFAEDNIGFEGKTVTNAYDVLCTARLDEGLPKRSRDDVKPAFYNFAPKKVLGDAVFIQLRAVDSKTNRASAHWNPARRTLAVEVRELRRWCTSQRSCLRAWLAPLPNFVDVAGFLALDPRPVVAAVRLSFLRPYTHAGLTSNHYDKRCNCMLVFVP